MEFLKCSDTLCYQQHGFITRSTITNAITCDKIIADTALSGHAYNVLFCYFKAAFDKAPHRFVVESLVDIGISGMPLRCFANFLTSRTQQVRVGDSLSALAPVISGTILGSCLGPGLHTVLTDTLRKQVTIPALAFADNFKFIADIVKDSRKEIQTNVDIVAL